MIASGHDIKQAAELNIDVRVCKVLQKDSDFTEDLIATRPTLADIHPKDLPVPDPRTGSRNGRRKESVRSGEDLRRPEWQERTEVRWRSDGEAR